MWKFAIYILKIYTSHLGSHLSFICIYIYIYIYEYIYIYLYAMAMPFTTNATASAVSRHRAWPRSTSQLLQMLPGEPRRQKRADGVTIRRWFKAKYPPWEKTYEKKTETFRHIQKQTRHHIVTYRHISCGSKLPGPKTYLANVTLPITSPRPKTKSYCARLRVVCLAQKLAISSLVTWYVLHWYTLCTFLELQKWSKHWGIAYHAF